MAFKYTLKFQASDFLPHITSSSFFRLTVALEMITSPDLSNLDGMLGLPLSLFPLRPVFDQQVIQIGAMGSGFRSGFIVYKG